MYLWNTLKEIIKKKLYKKKILIYCNDNVEVITYYNENVVVISVWE